MSKPKGPPPRHTFTRDLLELDVPDVLEMPFYEFTGLLDTWIKHAFSVASRVEVNEHIRVVLVSAGWDGGISGFKIVTERTESDEEYEKRLRGYAEQKAKKAAERAKKTEDEISRLEKRISELKGLQKGENDV